MDDYTKEIRLRLDEMKLPFTALFNSYRAKLLDFFIMFPNNEYNVIDLKLQVGLEDEKKMITAVHYLERLGVVKVVKISSNRYYSFNYNSDLARKFQEIAHIFAKGARKK